MQEPLLNSSEALKLYNCTTVMPDGNLASASFSCYDNDG